MIPGLVLCVDGGGTNSRARLLDGGGGVLASAKDGPCNIATDVERAVASLSGLWRQCAAALGRDQSATGDVTLAIGAAGLYVASARRRFLAACPPFARVETMSDGYAALIGSGGGKPCGIVIVGTGVAGHRLYDDGTSVQRDGWGWIAGDRGSGAWLGRRGLRHALEMLDGIVPGDALAERILAAFGGRAGIADGIIGLGPDRLGTLAPIVLACAGDGVASAMRIHERAVDHLAALARVLDLAPAEPLYMGGGLAAHFAPALAARLGRSVATPEADAMAGCFLVAAGRAPREVIAAQAKSREKIV